MGLSGEKKKEDVFGGIRLPAWDRTAFFDLWCKAKQPNATPVDKDRFCRMFMVLISDTIRQRSWQRTFAQHDIEEQDAAADVLGKLTVKVFRFKLEKPCPLTLIASMNSALVRQLISFLRSQTKKSAVALEQGPEEWDHIGGGTSGTPEVDGLKQAFRKKAAALCGTDKNVRRIYRFICRSILKGNGVPSIEKLPDRLVDLVDEETFLQLAYFANKIARQYCADR
jgi:hypothetical protein